MYPNPTRTQPHEHPSTAVQGVRNSQNGAAVQAGRTDKVVFTCLHEVFPFGTHYRRRDSKKSASWHASLLIVACLSGGRFFLSFQLCWLCQDVFGEGSPTQNCDDKQKCGGYVKHEMVVNPTVRGRINRPRKGDGIAGGTNKAPETLSGGEKSPNFSSLVGRNDTGRRNRQCKVDLVRRLDRRKLKAYRKRGQERKGGEEASQPQHTT